MGRRGRGRRKERIRRSPASSASLFSSHLLSFMLKYWSDLLKRKKGRGGEG